MLLCACSPSSVETAFPPHCASCITPCHNSKDCAAKDWEGQQVHSLGDDLDVVSHCLHTLEGHPPHFRGTDTISGGIQRTRQPDEVWLSSRLWIFRWIDGLFFLSSYSIGVNLDACAIKRYDVNFNENEPFALQSFKNFCKSAVFTPSVHSSIDGVSVAEFFWETSPLATIFRDIEYPIKDIEIVQRNVSALAGKAVGDAFIVFFGYGHGVQTYPMVIKT